MLAQQGVELLGAKGFVTYLDGMPEPLLRMGRLDQRPILGHPLIMVGAILAAAPAVRGSWRRSVHPVGVEAQVGRQLPQQRTELAVESEHAGGEEVGQRGGDVVQLLHVGDEPAALDGEDEVLRDGGGPGLEARSSLQGIEAAVDLDAVHPLGDVTELVALLSPFG